MRFDKRRHNAFVAAMPKRRVRITHAWGPYRVGDEITLTAPVARDYVEVRKYAEYIEDDGSHPVGVLPDRSPT